MSKELVNGQGKVFYEAKGTIKSYNPNTGYGFIFSIESPDKDIFFHVSQFIAKDKTTIEIGISVEFIFTEVDGKGLRAYQIKKV